MSNHRDNRPGGQSQRGGNQYEQKNQEEHTLDSVWTGYLNGGYFDADGNLKPEYVSRAQVEPLVKAMSQAKPPLTMHQMRRFFQHCRAIEARLKAKTTTWGTEKAIFYKLDSAAADAFGKSSRKIPKLFHDFIQKNVAVVNTEEHFLKGFMLHFEALVGFGSQHLKEKERN